MGREVLVGGGATSTPCGCADQPGAVTGADLAGCLDFLAGALTGPPEATDLDRAARAVAGWPLTDAESRRGAGLLVESGLAGESLERLRRDHDRLFVSRVDAVVSGHRVRIGAPIASPLAGDLPSPAAGVAAVASLRAMYTELGLPASPQPDHVAVVLGALAHLLGTPPQDRAVADHVRGRLVEEHLRGWVTRCLGRMQRGAQTFYYQGLAALGLAVIRAVVQPTSAEAQPPSTARSTSSTSLP